jgi:uncharacterized membrane protein
MESFETTMSILLAWLSGMGIAFLVSKETEDMIVGAISGFVTTIVLAAVFLFLVPFPYGPIIIAMTTILIYVAHLSQQWGKPI